MKHSFQEEDTVLRIPLDYEDQQQEVEPPQRKRMRLSSSSDMRRSSSVILLLSIASRIAERASEEQDAAQGVLSDHEEHGNAVKKTKERPAKPYESFGITLNGACKQSCRPLPIPPRLPNVPTGFKVSLRKPSDYMARNGNDC
jgi:hypothetical protein